MQLHFMSLNRLPIQVAVIAIAMCTGLIVGCNENSTGHSATEKSGFGNGRAELANQVITVSYPLQYLTERIAGDSIEVILPIPVETKDPRNWRPSREAIGLMQEADLIIANGTGATYANWLTTVSLPDSKIRNTASRGLSLSDYIAVEDVTVVHSHGPEGEHSHPTMVARTWLDPAIAKKQAIYIAKELATVYPDRAEQFETNLKALNKELDQLSEKIKSINKNGEHAVITATPHLKFLTRIAGVGDQHLTWFEAPSVDQARLDLKKIIDADGPQPSFMLFDNTLPSDEVIGILKENGLKPIAINLIDRKPETGDFLSELQANIEALATALK